jgi:hypothetical protein
MVGENCLRLFYSGVLEGGSESVTGKLVFSSTLSMTVNDFLR